MNDETTAVDGANPAAPAPEVEQEIPQESATAEGQNQAAPEPEKARDEKGRFVQERINELTKARRQAERERDAAVEQVQQLQQQRNTPAPTDRPPAFEDFTNPNEWAAAVAQHATQQAETQAERRFSERQQQTQQEAVFGSYEARERDYSAANPEYAEAYSSLQSSVRFAPPVLEVIATSDHGPAIVHHLGTHLDVADRISRMPPHMAAAEVARIEARLSAPKIKPVSSTPAPTPALSGGSAIQKDPGRMSDSEFAAWRRSQISQRGFS